MNNYGCNYFKKNIKNNSYTNVPINILLTPISALNNKENYRIISHFYRRYKYTHIQIINDVTLDDRSWKKLIQKCQNSNIQIIIPLELTKFNNCDIYAGIESKNNKEFNNSSYAFSLKWNSSITENILLELFSEDENFTNLIDEFVSNKQNLNLFSKKNWNKYNFTSLIKENPDLLSLFYLMFITSPGKKAMYVDHEQIINNSLEFKQFISTSILPLSKLYKQNPLLYNVETTQYRLIFKNCEHKILSYQYKTDFESIIIILNLSENNYLHYNLPIDNYFFYNILYSTNQNISIIDHLFNTLTISMPKFSGIILKSKRINLETLTINELKRLAKIMKIPSYYSIDKPLLIKYLNQSLNKNI